MLTYSGRRSRGPLAPVDLAGLVEGVLDLCRSALPEGATLQADLAARLQEDFWRRGAAPPGGSEPREQRERGARRQAGLHLAIPCLGSASADDLSDAAERMRAAGG